MSKVELYVVAPEALALHDESHIIRIDPDCRDGDNIADKQGYSELRAHYWVWKNKPGDNPVGFFQFRRYLWVREGWRQPYCIQKEPRVDYPAFCTLMDKAAVVAPMAEYTGERVRDRYARKHRQRDLETVLGIIDRRYPDWSASACTYLNGFSEYYCNMFVMRRNVFEAYCEWLFDILNEYDKSVTDIPSRTQGYLAERLFGIWFQRFKGEPDAAWVEVPRVHFYCYDDEAHHLRREKRLNKFIPPGSTRRVLVKKAWLWATGVGCDKQGPMKR